uniref:hypothetical protein n=1 Tax=Trichocoleus desertorum TaxID=1481672 RepID=UPI0025B5732A|nr:hypothetical protein [Trichocoleus desertorum]
MTCAIAALSNLHHLGALSQQLLATPVGFGVGFELTSGLGTSNISPDSFAIKLSQCSIVVV